MQATNKENTYEIVFEKLENLNHVGFYKRQRIAVKLMDESFLKSVCPYFHYNCVWKGTPPWIKHWLPRPLHISHIAINSMDCVCLCSVYRFIYRVHRTIWAMPIQGKQRMHQAIFILQKEAFPRSYALLWLSFQDALTLCVPGFFKKMSFLLYSFCKKFYLIFGTIRCLHFECIQS